MELVTVKSVGGESIEFSDGSTLYSHHERDCCESHYLDFSNLTLDDFSGMKFNLYGSFFREVEGAGILFCPVNNHGIFVPGYANNNGYYSSNLHLILDSPGGKSRNWDISNCQENHYNY